MGMIYFTHIPKTAGTAFKRNVLEANFPKRVFSPKGFRQFALQSFPDHSCISNHFPYGVHILKPFRKASYFTFLRDPVERSISHYYFVLQLKYEKWQHPDYARHSAFSLEEIWQDEPGQRYGALKSNLQTRFIAGLGTGFYLKTSPAKMLKTAKMHLRDKYLFVGIQERFPESCRLFQSLFPAEPTNLEERPMKTEKKPELSSSTLLAIENANELDLELYQYGLKLFENRSIASGK
ncbi:MAG: sulfotransferase family 2 domain-containing protein [Saprospirales bacterium]|nr:sulfotransferase family 2 domain-containing protein [Saprospirales bacterium]